MQPVHLELEIDALAVLHFPLLAIKALAGRIHGLDIVGESISSGAFI